MVSVPAAAGPKEKLLFGLVTTGNLSRDFHKGTQWTLRVAIETGKSRGVYARDD